MDKNIYDMERWEYIPILGAFLYENRVKKSENKPPFEFPRDYPKLSGAFLYHYVTGSLLLTASVIGSLEALIK